MLRARPGAWFALLACLLASSVVASAARAENALERARREGVVRIGFPNQIPYAYADERGILTGSDAEIAKLVTERMGIPRMEPVLTEFAALIPGLRARRFDIVLAMFVNPQRCAQVAFSEPIYGIGQALVVAKGNPTGVKDYGALAQGNARIGIMAGAVQAGYLKTMGVASERITVLPDMLSAVNAIKSGRADVFPISALPAKRLVATLGPDPGVDVVEVSPDPVVDGRPARGYGAFAFRKEDPELLEAFNAALAGLVGTDRHLAAIAPFGFDRTNLPDRTSAELCR